MAGWPVTLTGTHWNAPATSFDLRKQLLRPRHVGIRTENFTLVGGVLNMLRSLSKSGCLLKPSNCRVPQREDLFLVMQLLI